MSVTKLILPFSSIPFMCLLHGKYTFLPCVWVLVFLGLVVIYFPIITFAMCVSIDVVYGF